MLDRLSTGLRAYILLFALTIAAAAPGVFTMPTLDRDEARFAQASKQMLETGDYLMIRYQDGQRNKKPAGIHWLQSATTAAFSSEEAKQIWSYRLPSLLGAAFAACFTFWAGAPLIGKRAAFLGAALFSVGLLLTSEAHISKTDGVLVAITTLGVGALIRLWKGTDQPKRLAILFWFAMGFGFLIKGPVTPMVAGLAGLAIAAWERRYDWIRPLIWWPGPALFVAMVLPWFLAIQFATDGEFFRGAVGKDLRDKVVSASEGHGGPPGYHIAHLISHFFPATLLLVPAIVLGIRTIRDGLAADDTRAGLKFLVCWIVPTWLVFEFLPTKLSHYILPAYPGLALLCGWAALQLMEGVRAPVSRYASLALFTLGAGLLALILSPVGVGLVQAEAIGDFKTVDAETVAAQWSTMPAPVLSLIPGAIAIVMVLVFSLMNRIGLAISFAILTSISLGWHARLAFLPEQTWVQPTKSARIALADVCGLPDQNNCETQTPETVHAIGYAEPSFVFETGTQVFISPYSSTDLPTANEQPVAAYLVNLEDKDFGAGAIETIRSQAEAQNRCLRQSKDVYALNYSNGDPARFVALVVDTGPCPATVGELN